jgi:glycosyltransferase involved in cell wall biosynthesis
MISYKITFKLLKPLGWLYLLWNYKVRLFVKIKELVGLAYYGLTKNKQILVVYTKNHPRMNILANNPPPGVLFVRVTALRRNALTLRLAAKIDLVYEDGPTTFPLRTTQPIVKEYEHSYFEESKLANENIKKIFIMSQWAKPKFADPTHKMEVLYPVFPIQRIKRQERREITIFMSGAAAARKGADILFQAFENVENKFAGSYQLHLIMASNYKNESPWYHVNEACMERTRLAFEKSQNKPNVYFGGLYPTTLTNYVYKKADIYVLPTRLDTLAFSLIEAMSWGLPVIATNICAIPELIEHGVNGYVIDVKDFDVQSEEFFHYAVSEVEKYLTILIENAPLRLKMGEEALKRVERKFSLEYKRERLKKLFAEILALPPSP